MTAANKYPCRPDGKDKDCINDLLEAKGGKVARQERTRRGREENYTLAAKVCAHIQYDILVASMTVMNCLNNVSAFHVRELGEERYLFQVSSYWKLKKKKSEVKCDYLLFKMSPPKASTES